MTSGSQSTRPVARVQELRLPSRFGEERVAAEQAGLFGAALGFSSDRIDDLKTAVAELTLNAIEHGNRFDPQRRVHIQFSAESNAVRVCVRDCSREPLPALDAIGVPDLAAKLEGRELARGWGLFLVRSLANEMHATHTWRGNRVEIVVRPVTMVANTDGPAS